MVGSLFRRVIRASPQPAHYVFAAVFCARLIVLARLTGSASFFPSGGDAHFYDEWARRIAAGQWTDHHAFYGLPLYAYWLAGVYKVFGAAPFMPALIQIAFDSATATLIFLIGRRVFSEETPLPEGSPPLAIARWRTRAFSVGLAAAAGWALFVPAQAYSVILMPTAFGTFIFWLVVFQLIRRESAPTPRACLFLGGLIGFAAMGIATVSILIPLVVAAVLLKPAIDWQQTSVRR